MPHHGACVRVCVQMPLGAKLEKMAQQASYKITVPRIQLFDFWLQPESATQVEAGPDYIVLKSRCGGAGIMRAA